MRGNKGQEQAPLGGANITGQCAGMHWHRPSACTCLGCVWAHALCQRKGCPCWPPHPPRPAARLPAVLPTNGGQQPTVVASRAGAGDFYRPLAPGRYTIVVSKPGFKPFAANLTVPADGSGAQRHFVLAREGSSWGGEVAFSPRGLGGGGAVTQGGGASAAADGGGALPWTAGRKGGEGLDGEPALGMLSAVEATRGRDRLLMLGAGAACVYGLWVTHTRLKRRSHQRRA